MMGASLDLLLSLVEGRTLTPRRVAQVGRAIDALTASGRAGPVLRSLQRTRLADTLRHAASHAPFYRERLGPKLPDRLDGGAAEELLSQLPFTDGTSVRDWRQFLCVPEHRLSTVHTTSGTAGPPKVVAFTWGDLQRLVAIWAIGLRIGHRGPMRVLVALPATHGLWIGTASATRAIERAGGLPIPVGTPHPRETLDWMRRFEPNMIVSSPSYVTALTSEAERVGFRIALDRITLGGELLDEERRERIASYWRAPVSNSYGTTEIGGPQSISLPGCAGLHLNELLLVTEIVEPKGERAADEGDLVFTTLKREAMPLVRYRVGDRARWVSCDCGLPLRCVELLGRADDMITVGGAHLDPEVIARRITALGGASGRIAFVIDREELGDHLTLRVEGEGLDARAVHEALFGLYPRLREITAGGLLRLDVDVGPGVDLQRQVKAVSVVDRRPARPTS
jgi:phenylacetate-CoA ligase